MENAGKIAYFSFNKTDSLWPDGGNWPLVYKTVKVNFISVYHWILICHYLTYLGCA